MAFIKKLFALLLLGNIAFLSYDYHQGGNIAFNLVDNVKNLNQEKLETYLHQIKQTTPQSVAAHVNNAFAQLKDINSFNDLLLLAREKTSSGKSSTSQPEWEGNVLVLNDKNFHSIIDGSKPALVEFYAPWCGHCKNLAPTWAQLGDAFSSQKDKVIIAKIDADANRDTGAHYGVQGFPTLKWFPQGVNSPEGVEDYKGGRDLQSLANFVREKSGVSYRIKAERSDVVTLNTKNFHEVALNPNKHVFVEFYASWCGHCKNLAPQWEKLATIFANEPNVVIAKIDADVEKSIGQEFDISGFPTLKFFPAGASEPIAYDKARSVNAFVQFVNEQAGTSRLPEGGLLPIAGRIHALDKLAIQFIKDKDTRAKVHEEAVAAAKEIGTRYANYYAKLMEKILSQGDAFIETEKARLAKMLKNDDISSAKLDDFNIRQNILKVFDKNATPVDQ